MNMIYLDHAATTPIDPVVSQIMHETAIRHFANPSSLHSPGQQGKVLLEKARKTLADSIHAKPGEVIFTSGGTEANNLAILGAVKANTHRGNHLITSKIEHPSVINVFHYLETLGYKVSYLDVDYNGQPDLKQLELLIRNDTILVSLMVVNNETGCILPIPKVGELLAKRSILFHCDAVQAFGKTNISTSEFRPDLITVSAHKIYGPKGTGALFVRQSASIESILFGGSQETNRRPGTENLPAIVGFANAVEQLEDNIEMINQIASIRDQFEQKLKKTIPGIIINGEKSNRVCSHSNVYFPFISGDSLLINLDQQGIAASTGSACSSGSNKSSHVLKAMGFDAKHVNNSLRFSFGRINKEDDVQKVIDVIFSIYQRMNKDKINL